MGLKSADAARVKVLTEAAKRANCVAHLAIVHIEESGSANPTGYDHRPRRWGRYRDYDHEDEQDSSEDFEVMEVCNWRHYVAQWRNQRDQPVEFGEIPLEPGELLPDGVLDDEKPDMQRFMEASGNEGCSFERSYHRAALVLWRRERYAEVLLQAGVAAALPYLKETVEVCAVNNAAPAAQKEAIKLARKIVNVWKETPGHGGWRQPARPEKRDGMLNLLAQLGDADLLAKFIAEVVTRDYDGSDNAALVACAPILGAKKAGKLYAEIVCTHTQQLHGHCVDLLGELVQRGGKPLKRLSKTEAASTGLKPGANEMLNAEWRNPLLSMAEAIVSKLDEVGQLQRQNAWMDWRVSENTRPVNAALVANLLNTLVQLHAPALRVAAVKAFAARPAVFNPVTILVPALDSLKGWDSAATRLWKHSAEFLLKRSGVPPEAPKDWGQDAKLSCACADCLELQAFTVDPVAQVHRFRVKKERRQHLHQQIEHHGLDMTHVTERAGSPQTLVCTKDRRSYRHRCDEYRQDIAALRALKQMAAGRNIAAENLILIEKACVAAAAWRPA